MQEQPGPSRHVTIERGRSLSRSSSTYQGEETVVQHPESGTIAHQKDPVQSPLRLLETVRRANRHPTKRYLTKEIQRNSSHQQAKQTEIGSVGSTRASAAVAAACSIDRTTKTATTTTNAVVVKGVTGAEVKTTTLNIQATVARTRDWTPRYSTKPEDSEGHHERLP